MKQYGFEEALATMTLSEAEIAAAVAIAAAVEESPYVQDAGEALQILAQAFARGFVDGMECRRLGENNPQIAADLVTLVGMTRLGLELKADRAEIGPFILLLAMARTVWRAG